jgi:cell division protease FtsH
MSQDQALARIAMMMGGRVAEELAFQRVTTGASDDIKRATRTARRMVCDFGMSARLGPVFHGESEDQPFLGRDFGHMGRDYSEQTAIAIDEEVRRIITDQYQRALTVLMEKREILDRFAEALLDRETLDAEEVMAIFDGRPLPLRVKTVIPSWSDRRDKTKEGGRSRTASITVLADEQTIYDPRDPNDRLVLGMKGRWPSSSWCGSDNGWTKESGTWHVRGG